MGQVLDYKQLARDCDVLAPDGSEIRLLSETRRGSMVHCTLNPGEVSVPVAHRTVEELWYCLEGTGQMWRRHGDEERVVDVAPGGSLSIPTGAHFQFRTIGDRPLRFVIVTMPPWPGEDEAYRVAGHWPVDFERGNEP
jgi:mannose-6-phosphate isomerase-like protein (cupin superfamily)